MVIEIFISQFEKEQYFFDQFNSKFVFSSYNLLKREKNKQKYDIVQKWSRIDKRFNTIAQPDLPSYVIDEAFIKAKKEIKILTYRQYIDGY